MSDNENLSIYQEKIAEFNIDGMNVLPDKNYKALSQVTVQPAIPFLEMLQGTHSQLTDDDIPSSVDEITLGPTCKNFTSINISKPKKVILNTQLNLVEALNVHDAILEIQEQYAFVSNEILTTISGAGLILNILTFPDSNDNPSKIRTIPPILDEILPNYAFHNAQKLTTVSIENATNVPDYCFWSCKALHTINFKKGIAGTIGKNAFHNCRSLTNTFVIPDGITKIGDGAFFWCVQIKNFTFPESLISIGADTFYGCTSLTSITLPSNLEQLGRRAFEACTNITDIFVPDKIVAIPERCFSGCTSLTDITIPDSVITMDDKVFDGCTSLQTISLGQNISRITSLAFNRCTALQTITVRGNSSCVTAQALQALNPSKYNNANIVYTES